MKQESKDIPKTASREREAMTGKGAPQIQARGEARALAQVQHTKELVRILNTDIKGEANVYAGLTRIKGISWALSNVVCHLLSLDKSRKVSTLSDAEIKKLEEVIKSLHTRALPTFILNRPKMHESGPKHLIGTDIELQLRADIKSMRDIQSYKGIRHALGLPVRGQRTKSHFRHGRAVGVTKKKALPAKAAPKAGGK